MLAWWQFAEVELRGDDLPPSGEVHSILLDRCVRAHEPSIQLDSLSNAALRCFNTTTATTTTTINDSDTRRITLDTQVLVVRGAVDGNNNAAHEGISANEFAWSRAALDSSSMIMVEGSGAGNKAKTLLCSALQSAHVYWFTPEDAWLRNGTSPARALSDVFHFAKQRATATTTMGKVVIVLDALDSIFPSHDQQGDGSNDDNNAGAGSSTTDHTFDDEQDRELFLTLVHELGNVGGDGVSVIAMCRTASKLHPYLSDLFPSPHRVCMRSPSTIDEWEDFFFDRLSGREDDSNDTALAIACCQNNLSLAQVLSCFFDSGNSFSRQRFNELVQQAQFPLSSSSSSDSVPFTFIPRSTTASSSATAAPPLSSVGGQHEAKQVLVEALDWPLTRRQEMLQLGITRPIRGVLLCGAPGAGKTLLARAASTDFAYNFLSVSVSDLIRGNVGQSEQRVAKLFALAKTCKPCIVFFDECHALFASKHSLGPSGQKVLSQFLVEMDQLVDGIVMLAATNERRMVDSAVLGRFDRVVTLHGLRTVDDYAQVLTSCLSATNSDSSRRRFAQLDVRVVAQMLADHAEEQEHGAFSTGASVAQLLFRAGLEADEANNELVTEHDVAYAMLQQQPQE